MTGVINFLRNQDSLVVGKLFYFGGEGWSKSTTPNHYFECSDPDVSPYNCEECELSVNFSDNSFVGSKGDDVYNISEVELALLKYYNEIAPEIWNQSDYRPYRWKTIDIVNSATKYKTVKMFLDKDDDLHYILAELTQPNMASSNYIDNLRKHFEHA